MKFLSLSAVFAVFALAIIGFDASGENLREKEFAAKFTADNKLPAEETNGAYKIDKAHSHIGFRVMHMGLAEVPGAFRDFSGTIVYDAKDVSKSSVEFKAMMTSVDTGVAPRDNHLRNADFFEVEKYPEMTFKSTKVAKNGDKWEVTGDFTLKGVTKQITIPFTVNGMMKDARSGGVKMGISAQTSINRQDYGVKYGNKLPNGTLALSDIVKIDLQLEAAQEKKPAETPAK